MSSIFSKGSKICSHNIYVFVCVCVCVTREKVILKIVQLVKLIKGYMGIPCISHGISLSLKLYPPKLQTVSIKWCSHLENCMTISQEYSITIRSDNSICTFHILPILYVFPNHVQNHQLPPGKAPTT